MGLSGGGARWGNPPRRSEAEAWHARQQQREGRLIRRRLRQVQANLRPQHLDAYCELDQTQPQRVELRIRQRERRGISVRGLHIKQ